MKKFLSSLFISIFAAFGVIFGAIPIVSNANFAAQAKTSEEYSTEILAAFEDNEYLSAIAESAVTLESSFNVTNKVNLEVYDQNYYGTCYATALAQLLNLSYEYRYDEHIKVSASAIALQTRDLMFSDGAYPKEMLDSTFNLKYVSEFDFPYEILNVYNRVFESNTALIDLNFNGKEILDVEEYYVFPSQEALKAGSASVKQTYIQNLKKALVTHGALGTGLFYRVGLSAHGNYVYDLQNTNFEALGNHAMTIVGYDDNFLSSNFSDVSTNGAFLILNSWGKDREEIIYLSYEDVADLSYVFGVGDFIDADENDTEISNINKHYYSIMNTYNTVSLSENLEIGYQVSNTENGYLKQIDLQPIKYFTDTAFYNESVDVKIYVNPTSSSVDWATEYIGDFDIGSGTNKIVLAEPVAVTGDFAIKIVVTDSTLTYGYFDKFSQNFNALFDVNGSWKTVGVESNANLVRTPFYLRVHVGENEKFEISKEENLQTATTNAVVFDLTSNKTISDVGVQIFKHSVSTSTYDTFELSNTDVTENFDISVNGSNSAVSITPKSFVSGTYKVLISINAGEKTFIKFINLDDGINLTTMQLIQVNNNDKEDFIKQVLYSSSLMAETVNVTIPSAYYFYFIDGTDTTKFDLDNTFLFNRDDVVLNVSYSVDTSSRISKATAVFTHDTLKTSRTIYFNFFYETRNKLIYVTELPNATHGNVGYANDGDIITLNNASAPNHNFVGWYTSPSFTTKYNSSVNIDGTGEVFKIYAKFTQKTVPTFAKKVKYNSETNIMTVDLDFSAYNLGIYDVIDIYSIKHTFKEQTYPYDFTILSTNKYSYNIYVEEQDLNTVNAISFYVKIGRFTFRDDAAYYPYSYLIQSINVTDVVAVNFSKTGNGTVKNQTTGATYQSESVYVGYGGDLFLNITAEDNNYIQKLIVNGVSKTITNTKAMTVSLVGITSASSVQVVFAETTYEITTVIPNGGGTVDKKVPIEVVYPGDTIEYTFIPDEGYRLDYIEVNGRIYRNDNDDLTSFVFGNVHENYTIMVYYVKITYTITIIIEGSGSVGHDSGIKVVNHGDTITFNIEAGEGYTLQSIYVDGNPLSLVGEYSFENIEANHTFKVVFQKDVIEVWVEVVGVGSVEVYDVDSGTKLKTISTEEKFEATYASNLKFKFVSGSNYEINSIYVNGTLIQKQTEYVKEAINENIKVRAIYSIKTYNLSLTTVGSGNSDVGSFVTKNHGDSITYTFIPVEGYEISSVKVNGTEAGNNNSLTIENITQNYTIVVTFVVKTFEIKWFNYDGSLIKTTTANYGVTPATSFTIPTKPGEGIYVFEFAGWNTKLDGTGTGLVVAKANANYYAQFSRVLIKFEITASVGSNGIISPAGKTMVEYGSNQTYVIAADPGYHIYRVYVDGELIENKTEYTFENVKETHTISATFKKNDFKATITNNDKQGSISGGEYFATGERAIFVISPKEGYIIESVIVNGAEVKIENNAFIVERVTDDLYITVKYAKKGASSGFVKFLKDNLMFVVMGIIAVAGVGAISVFSVMRAKKKKKEDEELFR